MSDQVALAPTIASADHAALKTAVKYLEGRNFAARLADYAGVPVNRVLGVLPKAVNRQLAGMVRSAVMKGLEVAVDTLDDKPPRSPAMGFSSFLAGVTGGVSGLFGFGALAFELPLTTTLMLRAIAEIAQHQGEDLSGIIARAPPMAARHSMAHCSRHPWKKFASNGSPIRSQSIPGR